MVTVIPSACEVLRDGTRRPARRRCDRPVGAGRSTALRARQAPHQPGPGRQIVIKTGNAVSRFSSQTGTQSQADSTPLSTATWRIVTDHLLSATPAIGVPVGLSTYSLPTMRWSAAGFADLA